MVCTALVEEGGTQLLTVRFAKPSFAVEIAVPVHRARESTEPSCPWWCRESSRREARVARDASVDAPSADSRRGRLTTRRRHRVRHRAARGGCAKDAPQDTWQPAGENAQRIQDLQWPVFLIAGIVGVLVFGVLIYVVIRFRDRGQPIPKQTHGKPALEITLTVIPAVILAVIAGFTVRTVIALAKTDDTECVVNVTGQQWWWEYDYPVAGRAICGVRRRRRAARSSPAVSW